MSRPDRVAHLALGQKKFLHLFVKGVVVRHALDGTGDFACEIALDEALVHALFLRARQLVLQTRFVVLQNPFFRRIFASFATLLKFLPSVFMLFTP